MSTKRITMLERNLERTEKEFRQVVDTLVGEVELLKGSLEKLRKAGTLTPDPPAPAGKKARIPARPAVMKEAGVGKDPKKGPKG